MEPSMEEVKITELRQNLPGYLAKVKRGQRVRITSRGKVIAEIAPPSASKKEAEAARARLRGSVLRYDKPLEPVIDPGEWDVNK
jgi:prevent-host-death family protein